MVYRSVRTFGVATFGGRFSSPPRAARMAERRARSQTARTAPPAARGLRRRRDARVRQRRLRRGEPRERDAVRRAADVVEPEPVAERDGVRLAAVLAADAEL